MRCTFNNAELLITVTEMKEKQKQLAQKILTISRNTLLVRFRFLDIALSQFQWIPIEKSTLQTDGKHIFYNPLHVLSCYKSAKEIPVRDYLHMVLHCVFRHMFMNPSINRLYWDLACDIAVENVIGELRLGATAAPRELLQAKQIAAIKPHLKYVTAEVIYAYLLQAMPDSTQIETIHSLFCADDHTLWYMPTEPYAAHSGYSSSNENNNNDGDNNRKSNDRASSEGNNIDLDKSRAATAAAWQSIAQRMQMELESFSTQQGLNHGAMIQSLTAVNRKKNDYASFLKKFSVMGEMMKVNDDEFDYIFYTYGLQLYGNVPLIEPLEYKEVKAIKEFIIIIDTSGSTSDDLVQHFLQKTYNILKSTESFFNKFNLHIIQCDATIQEDKKITCQEEFDDYLKTMVIRGLGGTNFRPAFEYVDKLRRKNEFSNLKGLIYFTDGYGTFPAKKPDYETAFVFVDNGYINPQVPPWAIKLVLQTDEL